MSASSSTADSSSSSKSGSKPSAAKVYLYAEYLGIDLQAHPYLFQLMAEGLTCELPHGWKVRKLPPDEDGVPQHDFIHVESGRTSSCHPLDEVFLERARTLIKMHAAKEEQQRKPAPPISDSMFGADSSSDDEVRKIRKQAAPAAFSTSATPAPSAASSGGGGGGSMKKKPLFRSNNNNRADGGIGKQLRYVLYCLIFASFLHFVTYSTVFKMLVNMNENSAAAARAERASAVDAESASAPSETAK